MVSSFIRLALAINFALAVTGLVIPRVAPGTQFITGPCTADADCASNCCGVKTKTCNARAVAEGPTGGGCLGDALAASVPAAAPAAASPAAAPAGTQFITGKCAVDGDCASGCCGAKTGVCNARAVAEGPGGGGCSGSAAAVAPAAAATQAAAAPPAAAPAAAAPASTGTQFITGKCTADADCASGCCGAKTGVCNARAVAEGPGGGGCGGSAGAAAVAATQAAAAPPAAAPPATPAAAAPASTGTQFITGKCSADVDCASGCCGAKTGVCNARAVAEGPSGGGCGGSAAAAAPGAAAPPAAAPPAASLAAPAAAPAGTQFITGACSVDGDCASGCCGAKTGVCNARAVAEGPGGGGCGGKSA